MKDTEPKEPSRPLRRLFHYARDYRSRIWAAVTCSVVNKLWDLAPPVLIGAAVDVVVQREASFIARMGVEDLRMQLALLSVVTVVVWGLESLFEYAYQLLWRNLAQSLQHDLRLDAYTHVQNLELSWFEDRTSGGLMSILNDDINQLERFLDGGANAIIQVVTTVLAVGAAFFILVPSVAWLAVAPVPFILWGSLRFQRRMEPRYDAVREQVGLINSNLANNLGGIGTIKSFTAEDREIERIRDNSLEYVKRNAAAIKLSSAFVPLIRMAIVVGFTATLYLGGVMVLEGALAVGTYSVLVFMTQRLLWPLTRIGQTLDQYQRAMASTRRILNLMDTPPELTDGDVELSAPARHNGEQRGLDVQFEEVHFQYPSSGPVLRGIDLQIPAGDTVAVVGPTGAGKTSVVKLLLRFYDVTGGRITVAGHDLRDLTRKSLRKAIGLVSQDVFLFHGTVRDNLLYGRPDATNEELERAAAMAEAHEFIVALPDGYDTVIGERGQKLSGGQRQRISIARALLKDPPILVLDEATSAVDNETEAAIQRSLERLTRSRTTLVIAHRLSTIRNADRIYVLEQGEVAETGRHDELVEEQGLYKVLWSVQTGEPTRP